MYEVIIRYVINLANIRLDLVQSLAQQHLEEDVTWRTHCEPAHI